MKMFPYQFVSAVRGLIGQSIALALIAGFPLTGCITTMGESRSIINEINEIKLDVQEMERRQNDSFRKLEFSISQIDQKLTDQSVKSSTATSDIESQLANIRKELRKISGATQELQAANTQPAEPSEEARLFLRGQEAYSRGDFEQAIIAYSNYLASFPGSTRAPQAAYSLARCYYTDKRFEKAQQAFDNIISQYPTSNIVPQSLHSRALSERELSRFLNARATLQKLRLLYPDYEPERIEALLKLKELQ